jgi:hypothetical protein
MIPLVTAIEDLDAILPEDAQITWDQGRDCDFSLLIQSGCASYRFAIDTDTLLQRGEAYRKFLVGIARVLGVMAVELVDRRNPQRRAAALQETEKRRPKPESAADTPSLVSRLSSLIPSQESPAA